MCYLEVFHIQLAEFLSQLSRLSGVSTVASRFIWIHWYGVRHTNCGSLHGLRLRAGWWAAHVAGISTRWSQWFMSSTLWSVCNQVVVSSRSVPQTCDAASEELGSWLDTLVHVIECANHIRRHQQGNRTRSTVWCVNSHQSFPLDHIILSWRKDLVGIHVWFMHDSGQDPCMQGRFSRVSYSSLYLRLSTFRISRSSHLIIHGLCRSRDLSKIVLPAELWSCHLSNTVFHPIAHWTHILCMFMHICVCNLYIIIVHLLFLSLCTFHDEFMQYTMGRMMRHICVG